MKKALVYYLYGNRNAGDMAICMGTVAFLRKQGYETTMVSRFSAAEDEYHKSKKYLADYYPYVKVCPGPFSFDRSFSNIKKLTSYIKSMLKVAGIIPDRETKRLIKENDIVFFNGGNLLRGNSITDYLRLVALFYPIKIAYDMGKTIYCLPQSTAKISNFGEKMLNKYLRYFNVVYVRENISFKELTIRFPKTLFVKSTDMAFFCENTEKAIQKYQKLGIAEDKETIAVVVRNTGIGDIGELNADKQNKLTNKLLSFVKTHIEYHFLIVIQTKKDREFSKRIYEKIKKIAPAHIVENHDPLVLREIYKHVRVLFTMRLHAAILSLSASTPVIGLFSEEWGLKNPGIMRDYNMPFVMIEDAGEEIPVIPTEIQQKNIASNIYKYLDVLNNI